MAAGKRNEWAAFGCMVAIPLWVAGILASPVIIPVAAARRWALARR